MGRLIGTILLGLGAATTLIQLAMAANYTVGGSNGGWDSSTDLQTWTSSQQFHVGDNLIFQYTANHNLLEVSKADYDSCQASNALQSYSDGDTVIPLSSSGKRYFICGMPGHCIQGMKVEIDTLAASSSPTKSPSTSKPSASAPSPASTTSPPPSTKTSSSAPTPSVASPAPAASPAQSPEAVSKAFPPTSPLASPPTSPSLSPSSDVPSTESPNTSSIPSPSSANRDCFQTSLALGFTLALVMGLAF